MLHLVGFLLIYVLVDMNSIIYALIILYCIYIKNISRRRMDIQVISQFHYFIKNVMVRIVVHSESVITIRVLANKQNVNYSKHNIL